MSQSLNNTNCFNFTEDEVTAAVVTRATVSSLAFIVCALVIVVIIVFKGYKEFMYRLVIYFMTADLFQCLALVFEAVPVSYNHGQEIPHVREGWNGACVAFGFIDQISTWTSNGVIVWILLYLVTRVYHLYHLDNHVNCRDINASVAQKWCKEAAGILLILVIPFTFNWIPFLRSMYGLSGLFCWIREVSNGDCTDRRLSAMLMFSMSYGPLLFLILCAFLCFSVLTVLLCIGSHSSKTTEAAKDRFKNARKEMVFILAFPLLYYSLYLIIVVNRLYSFTHASNQHPFYPLWVAHVVASPSRLLVSPIAFLCHPYVWKTLLCHRKKNIESLAYYIVPPEMDDIHTPLVIRGSPDYGQTELKVQGLLPS